MYVPGPVTPEQLEAVALTECIDSLSRRLETRNYEIESSIPRPPSPPPEYDKHGKRINTREQRAIAKLETRRTLAVLRAFELIPNYVPPRSFTGLTRSVEKFYLPVHAYPHINFIGLLLGPRGNNLRRMETESGSKISIRGRGSVKEGGRAPSQPGSNENLHCTVSALFPENIEKAFQLIQEVVDTAIKTPEHQNDFKRSQLRQLAELNGTLRDYENQLCSHCHLPGHIRFACPERLAMIENAECRCCKAKGHLMKDCPEKNGNPASQSRNTAVEDFLHEIGDIDDDKPGAVKPNEYNGEKEEFSNPAPEKGAMSSQDPSDSSKSSFSTSIGKLLGPPGLDLELGSPTPLPPPAAFLVPSAPPPAAWKPPEK